MIFFNKFQNFYFMEKRSLICIILEGLSSPPHFQIVVFLLIFAIMSIWIVATCQTLIEL